MEGGGPDEGRDRGQGGDAGWQHGRAEKRVDQRALAALELADDRELEAVRLQPGEQLLYPFLQRVSTGEAGNDHDARSRASAFLLMMAASFVMSHPPARPSR